MIDVLRLAVILMGLALLVMDFLTFVYRKITEGMGLLWFVLGGVLLLLGLVPGLCDWTSAVPQKAVPALLLAGSVFLAAAFYISSLVSQLLRKNQELAMHVSLLNQENESILYELRELKESGKYENSVRH